MNAPHVPKKAPGIHGLPAVALIAFTCCLAAPLIAAPSDYPNRPIRLIVPSAPGAILDLVARVAGPPMSEIMGQPVVVDNRPGAGTNIGMEIVARAAGDGYTMLVASNSLPVNAALYPNLPFNVPKDLAPVSLVVSGAPYLVVVHPSLPVRSVRDLVVLAKAKPGLVKHSSGGYGTNIFMMGALFKHLTGTDMLHVPYKSGGQALAGVITGEADVTFFAMAAVQAQVKSGRLRALAITSSKRSTVVPQLPTVAEAGVPGYEFTSWVGLLAPGMTPPALVSALNGYIRKAVPVSGMAEKFASEGADVGASSPQEFAAHLKAEFARWSKVVKDLALRAE